MAGSEKEQPNRPNPPGQNAKPPRKPLQVMHISRKEEQEKPQEKISDAEELSRSFNKKTAHLKNDGVFKDSSKPIRPKQESTFKDDQNISMGDLLEADVNNNSVLEKTISKERSVDDFDFDEEAFLEALNENEPIGMTGEIAKGSVIGIESDGVYVDIGGKAPGFMPKSECGLGVITNLKERFPKGLDVEVLVTREQNADGMVTISCRALALRQSWEKVMQLESEGKVMKVKINGFNRGGVTCDLEGLRGFIPRSQLNQSENHESLVGKTIDIAFIEVNPDTRKLILSEKRAAIAARFSDLKLGQVVEGKVIAIKPYGFFIDLGGISGLLHQSMITNGALRSLREVFNQNDNVKALITDLDPKRGRIGLNTALLEGPPGEILVDKEKVLSEAEERAKKVQGLFKKEEEETSN